MQYSKICEALNYRDIENELMFMPNEIFTEFPEKLAEHSSDVGFAFSYYYLISYLYRFAKYVWKLETRTYNLPGLKRILGYSDTNKTKNYISRKGGILDDLGYTRTTGEYPVNWDAHYDRDSGKYDNWITTRSEYISGYDVTAEYLPPKKQIKLPIKIWYRDAESERNDCKNGTLFDIKNTTMIPVEAFIKCMSTEDLGVVGFWLYSFIKYKSSHFGGSYDVPLKKLPAETGIKRQKLKETLKALESYNMITNDHKPFILGIPDGKSVEACSFSANDSEYFLKEKRQIKVREVMSAKTFVDRGGTFLDGSDEAL